jgi:enediyne biosynthesis protein E3
VRRRLRRLFVAGPRRLEAPAASFEVREPWKRERIRRIAAAFLRGYNALVRADDPAEIHPVLRAVPRFYRPFAYEGAAMGFGPWSWIHRRGYGEFETVFGALSPATLYQSYVGLGWWLGMRFGGRPGPIARVADSLDHRYRLIVYEGIGFRHGFLRQRRAQPERAFRAFAPAARHVCYQGYGRSLWFVYMDALDVAFAAIDRLDPEYHGDCSSGVGLGVAYSLLDRIESFDDVAACVPPAWLPDFLQGAAFGWEARRRADPQLFELHAARLPAPARARVDACVAIVHEARARLEAEGVRDSFYQAWRARTRDELLDAGISAGDAFHPEIVEVA